MAVDEKLMREAEEVEREHAEEALHPNRLTEADLREVMELDAVDQYVAATGEYPQSGDVAGPDVVDDTLFADGSLADDRVTTSPEVRRG
jgi:hypothetical protein